jgi:hypothetical protein
MTGENCAGRCGTGKGVYRGWCSFCAGTGTIWDYFLYLYVKSILKFPCFKICKKYKEGATW